VGNPPPSSVSKLLFATGTSEISFNTAQSK